MAKIQKMIKLCVGELDLRSTGHDGRARPPRDGIPSEYCVLRIGCSAAEQSVFRVPKRRGVDDTAQHGSALAADALPEASSPTADTDDAYNYSEPRRPEDEAA